MSDQSQDSTDGVISLLAGIGVGVLVGAAVALLLAPQAGEQTRAQLRESADDALSRLRDSMDDLRHRVDEIASSARGSLTSRSEPGQGDAAGATDETALGPG